LSASSGINIYNDTSTGTYNYSDIDVSILGGDADDALIGNPYSAVSNADINGDGIVDLVIGGNDYYDTDLYGTLHVIYGGALDDYLGNEYHIGSSYSYTDLYFMGSSGDHLGSNVISGDVTGDGLDDLIIAASSALSGYGETYVYPGSVTDFDSDGVDSTVDLDGDGVYDAPLDCNDNDSGTGTNTWYADDDEDGYGDSTDSVQACTQPDGYVADDTDCDDTDSSLSSTTTYYVDSDGDGYGSTTTADLCTSSVPSGYSENSDDCDDSDSSIYATSTYYVDSDGDGYGSSTSAELCASSAPSGYSSDNSDCDDTDSAIYAGNTFYVDSDGDGYGSTTTAEVCASSAPSGYSSDSTDCDDTDSAVNPAATEVCGDSVDNDCSGTADGSDASDASTWYADDDSDTYGDSSTTQVACTAPSGYVSDATDCDDTDSAINPAASEVCDGSDNDCDGTTDGSDSTDATTWYIDNDGDDYGVSTTTQVACSEPSGYADNSSDCDDTDSAINPGATETCDGADNDCDGSTDEGVQTTYYEDADSDSYGNSSSTRDACSRPSGYVTDATDCDDTNSSVNPGASEACDGTDNDCDGSIDDGLTFTTYFEDGDSDTYGNVSVSTSACAVPTGYVSNSSDCDDTDSSVNPAASETCDGTDNDCDGTVDNGVTTTYYLDSDSDGYGDSSSSTESCSAPSGYVSDDTDCDDGDSSINPGASEVCDGSDNDCDGTTDLGSTDATTWYIDNDSDSYGNSTVTDTACSQPSGYVADDTDCDDTNSSVNPGATEMCDGIDNDCDGTTDNDDASDATTFYLDNDGDGYGDSASTTTSCSSAVSGYVDNDDDCDDTSAAVNPAGTETCGDGVDQNCDGADLSCSGSDADGDGFTDGAGGDCDDTNATIYPGADEYCDGVDNNCDGDIDENTAVDTTEWYLDLDEDGYGDASSSTIACDMPVGYTDNDSDCDDSSSDINPAGSETCGDGIDQNCDGVDIECEGVDADEDGYTLDMGDCDDTNSAVYPNADEIGDAIDNDCDGQIDENLMSVSVANLDNTVSAGNSFSMRVVVQNDTGFNRFNAVMLVANEPIGMGMGGGGGAYGIRNLIFGANCSDADSCEEVSEALTILPSNGSSRNFIMSGTMPNTREVGRYYVEMRFYDVETDELLAQTRSISFRSMFGGSGVEQDSPFIRVEE